MKNLITIKSIQEKMANNLAKGRLNETAARRMWWAALDVLQEDFLLKENLNGGVWLASPLPALYEKTLLKLLRGWVWTPDVLENLGVSNIGLLPPTKSQSFQKLQIERKSIFKQLSLHKQDGIDPFLIVITSDFQIALTLFGTEDSRRLIIKDDHETLHVIMQMLHEKLQNEHLSHALELRNALNSLGNLKENKGISKRFWPLISEKLALNTPSLNIQTLSNDLDKNLKLNQNNNQISLLEAITHEVRTPLSTIRTLIRSLLRRKDISEIVMGRLKDIDSECTEQIDRFGLIFRAAELERNQPKGHGLARTDLGNMLKSLSPLWIDQLKRRGIQFDLKIAKDLPQVLSDPEQLELMLGGLIDRNTRGLSSGGKLFLELSPAGQRLKLEILGQEKSKFKDKKLIPNANLGTVLSWNPSTGSLQLSEAATQKLLASLGGRLTQRRGLGLIVFFPIYDAN